MTFTAKYAIIVAGGSGQRMGSKIPKQFLEIKGRPILMRTIEAFHDFSPEIKIILLLPEAHLKTWTKLCDTYQFKAPITVQVGGSTRFQSVKRGLQMIPDNGIVAIHDGVRPLVDSKLIARSFEIAENKGSAVASIPMKDSIRKINSDQSSAVNRADYRIIQTPQTFSVTKIKKAYKLEERETFTDDASVWEAAGNPVCLIEGNENNIKITTVQDLVIAEILMKLK